MKRLRGTSWLILSALLWGAAPSSAAAPQSPCTAKTDRFAAARGEEEEGDRITWKGNVGNRSDKALSVSVSITCRDRQSKPLFVLSVPEISVPPGSVQKEEAVFLLGKGLWSNVYGCDEKAVCR